MSTNMGNETDIPTPNVTQKSFQFDLTFFQFVYMNFLGIASIVLFVKFALTFHKGRSKLSSQLKIHIICWIIFLICSMIYMAPYLTFICLFPGVQKYSLFWTVMRGSIHFAAVNTICLSTSFIAIDRIFALLSPTSHHGRLRYYIHLLSILIIVINFIVMFAMVVERSYAFADSPITECLALNCILQGRVKNLVLYKIGISWLNFVLGALFIYLFFSYGRKTSVRREKKKNLLVLNILISELCFTIIPGTFYLMIDYVSGTIIATILNSIMSISYCTDGLANAIFYWRTWNEKSIKYKPHTRTVMPSVIRVQQSSSISQIA